MEECGLDPTDTCGKLFLLPVIDLMHSHTNMEILVLLYLTKVNRGC